MKIRQQREELAARRDGSVNSPPYIRTLLLNQTVEYDNHADQWSADFLVNDRAVAPRSANSFAPSQTVEYNHRHTTGISDDGEAGTPRSARIYDDCGAVLIFRRYGSW